MSYSLEAQMLFLKTEADPVSGCWLWKPKANRKTGYGEYFLDGIRRLAHRASYELTKGPIPEGLQIDHICRVRNCINPEHLRCVTIRENVLCGDGPAAKNAVKTHCKYGHEFTPENTFVVKQDGRSRKNRRCRECSRLDCKRRRNGKYVSRNQIQ